MPCYTERKITVELQAANRELLLKGLTALGITATESRRGLVLTRGRQTLGVLADGRLELEYGVDVALANEIKQAYSGQVVQAAARRFGWTIKQEQPNQFLIQRRF